MTSYPLDRIREEVAFIAYYFNWSHDEIVLMPHEERRSWCEEVSRINDSINKDGKKSDEYR